MLPVGDVLGGDDGVLELAGRPVANEAVLPAGDVDRRGANGHPAGPLREFDPVESVLDDDAVRDGPGVWSLVRRNRVTVGVVEVEVVEVVRPVRLVDVESVACPFVRPDDAPVAVGDENARRGDLLGEAMEGGVPTARVAVVSSVDRPSNVGREFAVRRVVALEGHVSVDAAGDGLARDRDAVLRRREDDRQIAVTPPNRPKQVDALAGRDVSADDDAGGGVLGEAGERLVDVGHRVDDVTV